MVTQAMATEVICAQQMSLQRRASMALQNDFD
jgi:hypothetical protein